MLLLIHILQAPKHFECTVLWITLTYSTAGRVCSPLKWILIIFSVWLLNPTMNTPPCAELNPQSTLLIHVQSHNHWHRSHQKLLMLKFDFLTPMLPSSLDQSRSTLRGVMVTELTLGLCLINVVGPVLTTQEEIKRWWHFRGGICNFHKYEGVLEPGMTAHKINTNNLNP